MQAFSLWLILPGTGIGIGERMLNKTNVPFNLEHHNINYVNALMHKLLFWEALARKAKHTVHVINKGDILHMWPERLLEMMTQAENQKLRKAQTQKRSSSRGS